MAFTTLIDARALSELSASADPNLVLLDCRFDLAKPQAGHDSYLAGHIPGAHFADLNSALSSPIGPQTGRHPLPDPRDFAANMAAWGIRPGTQVIAYDEVNGSFAARAWWLLRWVGHREVAVLDGGFKAWLAAGGSQSTGEEGRAPHALHATAAAPTVNAAAVLDAGQVAAALYDPKRLLIDARAAERYAGSVEPIDTVAGHVPGATNHPFAGNLGVDGRFLPPEQLRQRWQSVLAGRAAPDVIAMCGSGVTACHNLLSLEVAGLHGAKLYAGSWSEWIRDPRRPVATGTS
jgi:thiosulfate/3-mercaptopyruvate sulfurtransferase